MGQTRVSLTRLYFGEMNYAVVIEPSSFKISFYAPSPAAVEPVTSRNSAIKRVSNDRRLGRSPISQSLPARRSFLARHNYDMTLTVTVVNGGPTAVR